jgi:hypothetical protein
MSFTDDVRAFHRLAQQAAPDELTIPVVSPATRFVLAQVAVSLKRNREALEGLPVDDKLVVLRARLMLEELGELLAAMAVSDTVEIADGLADLIYVTVGTGIAFGVPLDRVWSAVQEANMAKFPQCSSCWDAGHVRPDCEECSGRGRIVTLDAGGKVVKPDGWKPADITAVLKGEG